MVGTSCARDSSRFLLLSCLGGLSHTDYSYPPQFFDVFMKCQSEVRKDGFPLIVWRINGLRTKCSNVFSETVFQSHVLAKWPSVIWLFCSLGVASTMGRKCYTFVLASEQRECVGSQWVINNVTALGVAGPAKLPAFAMTTFSLSRSENNWAVIRSARVD